GGAKQEQRNRRARDARRLRHSDLRPTVHGPHGGERARGRGRSNAGAGGRPPAATSSATGTVTEGGPDTAAASSVFAASAPTAAVARPAEPLRRRLAPEGKGDPVHP